MNSSAIQAAFEKLRSNKAFEFFVVTVIIASALLIGVKTYELPAASRTLLGSLDVLMADPEVGAVAR